MFFTTIIPTIGRTALRRAVRSVLDQDFQSADYEIIVVNDSGSPLIKEDWQQSPRVKIVNTVRVERCLARNVGAAIARGEYLHFLDDDDWLLPGSLNAFWNFAQKQPAASWLYGGTALFDRADQPIINLLHRLQGNCFTQVMAGEWIPLQSSFIKHLDFLKIGGFTPSILGEDVDLARRMALQFEFCGMDHLVAGVGVGEANSTTNQLKVRHDTRYARETILNAAGVYQRFWQSAGSPYWRGRIIRVYLTSAYWNLKNHRFFSAASRLLYGSRAMFLSIFSSGFKREFWQAISGPYKSETFARGFAEQQHSAESGTRLKELQISKTD